MYILGISAFYHDSAACLIKENVIIAAAQEERFTRKKHDASFPQKAISYCLKEAGITPSAINSVVFYEKPFIKFERLLETYLAFAPKGFKSFSRAMPLWIKDKLFQKYSIVKNLEAVLGKKFCWKDKLLFSEHHLSHAASAFYPSPFEKAAILTLDGVGEWTTSSIALGQGKNIEIIKEIRFPHSIGLLYSAFTYYLGFKVNSGEYKVMGLAPYGKPKYVSLIKNKMIRIFDDGSFQLNMKYFDFATGFKMTNKHFHKLLGGLPRQPETEITQREMDIASSIQKVTEDLLIKISRHIKKETKQDNLCLAGGVALNCVANGILQNKGVFNRIWIQPASGDSGGAIGAALATWYMKYSKVRNPEPKDSMKGSLLGPQFSDREIEKALKDIGANFQRLREDKLINKVSDALVSGKAIGWMDGKMEFGPRALGSRSIIADPRSKTMQQQLNLKVKFRESFRPFAPSVLKEKCGDWFDIPTESPYMLLVGKVKKDKRKKATLSEHTIYGVKKINAIRSKVPAITHIDYTARIQTVDKDHNERYYKLINKFYEKTGIPMIINTSFNVRGEPIVCTPIDAYKCFMGTDLDILAIGNFFLLKEEQDKNLKQDYSNAYELD